MAFSLSFSTEDGWFFVSCEGNISCVEEFSRKAATVLAKIVESGHKRVLFDDRKLALTLDALDITQIADMLGKADIQSMGLRLASLCRHEDRATYSTLETIYRNRSINLRIFEDRDAALAWLTS